MRLTIRRLRVLQRKRIGRGFYLESKGYRFQAWRVWSSVDRLTRAIEKRCERLARREAA